MTGRRLLTHVPDEVTFATKPQLTVAMLVRGRNLGIKVRWLAGDGVYGGRELRAAARALDFDCTLAVRAARRVDTPASRFTTTALAARVPARNSMHLRTGHGLKGDREYDWAMLRHPPRRHPGSQQPGYAHLFLRRQRYTR